MNRDKVIKVRNLVKKFGSFVANDNLSFDVYEGEIFGFLGANGAGKTTAIRILTGLSEPTSGEVMVAGFDARRQPEEIKKNLQELHRLTRGALAEMRTMLMELRPNTIVNTDLGNLPWLPGQLTPVWELLADRIQ